MKKWLHLAIIGLLGCAPKMITPPPLRTITLNQNQTYDSISTTKPFDILKQDFSITQNINFGPDPHLEKKAIKLSKQGINFEIPERRIEAEATIWDIKLLKAYVWKQGFGPGSSVEEEFRRTLLADHEKYTQFLVTIDCHVSPLFHWSRWKIWLVDGNGKTYIPLKTKETTEPLTVNAVKESILGQQTERPAHTIFRSEGTIYFEKLDLVAGTPWRLILAHPDDTYRLEFDFRFKGHMLETPQQSPGITFLPPLSKKEISEAQTVSAPLNDPDTLESPEMRKKRHFQQATERYQKGDYAGAIEEWEAVLDLDPTHALSKAKIKKARAHLPANAIEDEDSELLEVEIPEEQKDRQKEIHFLLATEHFKNREYEKAIIEWQNVLNIDPNHELSKDKILKARLRLGDSSPYGIAQEEKKAMMKDHYQKAMKFYSMMDYDSAIMEWEKVLELDPTHEISQQKIDMAKQKKEELINISE